MINYVHAEVSMYKIPRNELIFLGCNEAEMICLGRVKISWTNPSPLCVCAELPLGSITFGIISNAEQ